MMNEDLAIVEKLYERFNARDIDGVLSALAEDVTWANGMDGGHVHGHAGVREYWTRQWQIVSPHVRPTAFRRSAEGYIIAEVVQTIRDLDGKPLENQSHGLTDKTVGHIFQFHGGKVTRFDIEDAG